VTVDHDARGKARDHFTARFEQTVARGAQLAPATLGNLSPKRGYVRTPDDTTGMVQIEVELTEAEVAKKRKEAERGREKVRKEAEKLQRKAKREEAKRAKELGKANAKGKRRKARLPAGEGGLDEQHSA
jgi:hypothetical protein